MHIHLVSHRRHTNGSLLLGLAIGAQIVIGLLFIGGARPAQQVAQSPAGNPSSPHGPNDPSGRGQFQEDSVRDLLSREGYEQPFGKSDAEIRRSLNIQGKTADFVGHNPATNRWVIAESKGGDIEAAVEQLKSTANALFRKQVGATAANTEVRIYTNASQYGKLFQKLAEGPGIGGYRIQNGYLGYLDEAGNWLHETAGGIRIMVQAAP